MKTAAAAPSRTLVWVDAREAIIIGRDADEVVIERVVSEVPDHRRSTGHVRHDPSMRHGGGGTAPQTAGDPHRLEHLARFVRLVASRLPDGDDLTIIGPGTVREHLAHEIATADRHHHRERDIRSEAAGRKTDRQLTARLNKELGIEPRRRTVGAYRWCGEPGRVASGRRRLTPVRVSPKPGHGPSVRAELAEEAGT
jgi:hypothetical protein